MVASRVVRYRSKVDWWLAAIIVLVPLVALASAIAVQITEGGAEAIVGWVVVVAVVGLYVAILWPLAYELHPDEVVVRFGLLRSRVPYRSIRSVRPSRSVIASPALSMDRLAIDAGPRCRCSSRRRTVTGSSTTSRLARHSSLVSTTSW